MSGKGLRRTGKESQTDIPKSGLIYLSYKPLYDYCLKLNFILLKIFSSGVGHNQDCFRTETCQRRTTLQKEMKETDEAGCCLECDGDIGTFVSWRAGSVSPSWGNKTPDWLWNIPPCVHAQLYPTLCHLTDCSLPGFSIHGIFQARILEWIVISTPRASSQPKGWNQCLPASPALAGGFLPLSHLRIPEDPIP